MRSLKKQNLILILAFLLIMLSIGYALISQDLLINGSSKINNPTWNIHFENVSVKSGSVTGTQVVKAATLDTITSVGYSINLDTPGDYYEFTVDAVNSGSIDGMIESVSSKLNNVEITTLPAYLSYSVTYSNGDPILVNQKLKSGKSETYKVRIEFKKDINASDLPTNPQTLTLNFEVVYVQADGNAIERTRFVYRSNDTVVTNGDSLNDIGTYYNTYQELIQATGKGYFFRHKIEDGIITETSFGFFNKYLRTYTGYEYIYEDFSLATIDLNSDYSQNIYFIVSKNDNTVFQNNKQVLKDAFGETRCTETSNSIRCMADQTSVEIENTGYTYGSGSISINSAWLECYITTDGESYCY